MTYVKDSDNLGKVRSVRYAVLLSTIWDNQKYTIVLLDITGYLLMKIKIFENRNNKSRVYVYYSQCNWTGYEWGGKTHHYFRFRDSASTNAYKHAGNCDEYKFQYTGTTSHFPGIVCIRN